MFNWFKYEWMLLCSHRLYLGLKQVDDNQELPSPQKEPEGKNRSTQHGDLERTY